MYRVATTDSPSVMQKFIRLGWVANKCSRFSLRGDEKEYLSYTSFLSERVECRNGVEHGLLEFMRCEGIRIRVG